MIIALPILECQRDGETPNFSVADAPAFRIPVALSMWNAPSSSPVVPLIGFGSKRGNEQVSLRRWKRCPQRQWW
jgi:hypothetical protein